MVSSARAFLIGCAAILALVPKSGSAECEYDFVADLSIQILNRSTQIPIDDYRNNWNGSIVVREDWLMPIEVWGYRVDLRFRNAGDQRWKVGIVLQERTSPDEVEPMGLAHDPNATYKKLNSTALEYEVRYGTPLIARPDIGEVTLDLTLYPYSPDAGKPVSERSMMPPNKALQTDRVKLPRLLHPQEPRQLASAAELGC